MISIKNLHEQEGGNCYYCDCETKVPKYRVKKGIKMIINNPKNGSREHLIPQCEGGLGSRINIKLACSECNTLRGNMNAITWKIIASNPSLRRGYIKMKQDLKFLNKREKQRQMRAKEITEESFGIKVRHHTWAIPHLKEVFGVAA